MQNQEVGIGGGVQSSFEKAEPSSCLNNKKMKLSYSFKKNMFNNGFCFQFNDAWNILKKVEETLYIYNT